MLIWIYRSRKLNSQLENAIQEAMLELDRMTEQQQSVSAAVGNESTGRLRRSTRR
jgi:ABC-type phosphate/phosphonate transport system substrate-binding protein